MIPCSSCCRLWYLRWEGTTCTKLSDGFTRVLPSVLVLLLYPVSFGFPALTLERIDAGVACVNWSGMGTVFVAAIGILWF